MNKLTKKKLIVFLSVEHGFTNLKSRQIVDDIFDLMSESLIRKQPICITGLGTLQPKNACSRMVGFGKKYKSKEVRKVKFVISKALHDKMNKIKEDEITSVKNAFKRLRHEDE